MDFRDIADYLIEGKVNGCVFEAFFDDDNRILHVLDVMGKDGENRSVTNAIEEIIALLDGHLNLKHMVHRVFIYGTDKIVCEFYEWDGSFRILNKNNDLVFSAFTDKMIEIYS